MSEKRRIDEFAESLKIFSKYDGSGFGLQPEHDQVYVSIDHQMTPGDCQAIKDLGWLSEDHGRGLWWSKFS